MILLLNGHRGPTLQCAHFIVLLFAEKGIIYPAQITAPFKRNK